MISSTLAPPAPSAPRRLLPLGLLRDLDSPGDLFRHLGPNWYASIMGTGIVANAAATLPKQFPGLRTAATAVWALAAVLLAALTAAWAVHWTRHRQQARSHLADPVMSHFYGAPPMALLTVGAGTLLLGRDVLGLHTALVVDWVLWTAGTATGLFTAVLVPYLVITSHRYAPDAAFGGWLMPIVPPMVSAATGALLVPHISGQAQQTLLLACYAMFGLSLIAALMVIAMLWSRLIHHGVGPAAAVPTLWIVLGPLGQSVTAASLLAAAAAGALPASYASGSDFFAVLYGSVTWGFALLWLALAAAITLHTVRTGGLAFSMTWWSFTFPVGTVVTGTTGLAGRTHLPFFAWAAVALYVLLAGAWATVATRTALGSLRGRLFLSPRPPGHPAAHA